MRLQQGLFAHGQGIWPAKDFRRHGNHAHVVQQSRNPQGMLSLAVQPELAAQSRGQVCNALGAAGRVWVVLLADGHESFDHGLQGDLGALQVAQQDGFRMLVLRYFLRQLLRLQARAFAQFVQRLARQSVCCHFLRMLQDVATRGFLHFGQRVAGNLVLLSLVSMFLRPDAHDFLPFFQGLARLLFVVG